ncbi:MAG: magnesium transporter CorA family protein [Propionibacteriaceae bacterium]
MSAQHALVWRAGGVVAQDFTLDVLDEYLADPENLVWFDLCEPKPATLAKLAEELQLDQNAVENVITPGERPKATRYASHIFVTMYATEHVMPAEGEPDSVQSRIEKTRVSAFVLPHGLITIRSDPNFDMGPVVAQWLADPDLLTAGSGALLHGVLDAVVDGHFVTIQEMDDALEAVEDQLFDEHLAPRQLQQTVYRLRKELVDMRRVVLPMREVVNTVLRHRFEFSTTPALVSSYEDLNDHVLRAAEWTESLRDLVSSIFETNLSLQDARLNNVMKKLAAWAAIIALPTLITGWFGQNVPYPGFSATWGFWLSTLLCIGGVGVLYLIFKRRDWL